MRSIPWAVRLSWLENAYLRVLRFRRAILPRKVGQIQTKLFLMYSLVGLRMREIIDICMQLLRFVPPWQTDMADRQTHIWPACVNTQPTELIIKMINQMLRKMTGQNGTDHAGESLQKMWCDRPTLLERGGERPTLVSHRSDFSPVDYRIASSIASIHWRRQLWDTGACAPSTSNNIFFSLLRSRTKSITDTSIWFPVFYRSENV